MTASKAFLFSLVNKPHWDPLKLPRPGKGDSTYAHSIYTCSSYGPTFGAGRTYTFAIKLRAVQTPTLTFVTQHTIPHRGTATALPSLKLSSQVDATIRFSQAKSKHITNQNKTNNEMKRNKFRSETLAIRTLL